jgi:uncharacterized protein (TIGR02453 family)
MIGPTETLALTLRFLDDLRGNNDQAWFEANRPAYAAAAARFERFVNRLIDQVRGFENLPGLTAAACLHRIDRDPCPPPGQPPFYPCLAATLAQGGRTSCRLGYYVVIAPGGQSQLAGGLYNARPKGLARFMRILERDADGAAFKAITGALDFVEAFGPLDVDKLRAAAARHTRRAVELLQLKDVAVVHYFVDTEVVAPDFVGKVATMCRVLKPLLDYMNGPRAGARRSRRFRPRRDAD